MELQLTLEGTAAFLRRSAVDSTVLAPKSCVVPGLTFAEATDLLDELERAGVTSPEVKIDTNGTCSVHWRI